MEELLHRKHRMQELMNSDPEAFLAASISIIGYAGLPDGLKPHVERPVSATGTMDVLWKTSLTPDGRRVCLHRNQFVDGEQSLELITLDQQMLPVSRNHLVNGVALEGKLVVGDSPVQVLENSEQAAAAEMFGVGNPDGIDPVTNRKATQVAALIGGEVYQFSDSRVLDYVEQRLVSGNHRFEWLAASGGGDLSGTDVDATPYQEDQIEVLFIRVDFSDFPGEPVTKADLETSLGTVDGHLHSYSYGNAALTYTVSDTVYRMPSTGDFYATYYDNGIGEGGNDLIQDDARELADGDFILEDYDVIAVFFPDLSDVNDSRITYGGLASIGGNRHWINGSNNVGILLHEFGHNYGLYHANYHHPEQVLGSETSYQLPGVLEYGDIFDEMGTGNAPESQFNHLMKQQLGWMPDSKVAEATAEGTWRIYRFDDFNALSNSTLALKVPMSQSVNYWVGYRQLFTSSAYNLETSAYVVGENMGQVRETLLIDMTPESQASESNDREDAGLPVGSTYYDSDAGVRFSALARGGTAPNQWIDIQIEFDPRISIVDTTVEVDEQSGQAKIVLRRSFSVNGSISVDYATAEESATDGSDYYGISGTVTWEEGDGDDKTLLIPIRPDVVTEGIESFTLALSNITGGILDSLANTATVHILDPGQRYAGFGPEFFNTSVNAIVPLENGQILIGGDISNGIGDAEHIRHIARLNPDGSVDTSFATGAGFNQEVTALALQTDGKLLVGGMFTEYNGVTCNGVARLNPDGSLDTGFATQTGTGANGLVRCLAIEAGGGILAGGDFTDFDGTTTEGLVRLTSAGAVDTGNLLSLPFDTGWSTEIHDLLVEPSGTIMVAGLLAFDWTGTGFRSGIARLHPDGTRDTGFDPGKGAHVIGSPSTISRVFTIQRLNDGRYLIGGQFTAYDENAAPRLARIQSNGAFDASYTPPAFDDLVLGSWLQPAERPVLVGRFLTPANRVERLMSNGSVDTAFNQGAGAGNASWQSVSTVAADAGGQLWLGGNFFAYDGATSRPIVRIAGGVSPYELWAQEQFTPTQILAGDADPDADPDEDSIENLAELAMGLNPNLANPLDDFAIDPVSGIEIISDGGNQYLQLTLEKNQSGDGVWFLAQFSDDLI
ncbi:MAG: hypothetical protein PF795_06790, partial [Kiritimatiellae bacterium]|nr:hypothetical protein [Kiritimatiellia bacterium]